jgi:hypothetical protein
VAGTANESSRTPDCDEEPQDRVRGPEEVTQIAFLSIVATRPISGNSIRMIANNSPRLGLRALAVIHGRSTRRSNMPGQYDWLVLVIVGITLAVLLVGFLAGMRGRRLAVLGVAAFAIAFTVPLLLDIFGFLFRS